MSEGKGKSGLAARLAEPVFRRRLAIRAGLVLLVIGLGAFAMVVGRGHTVVLDDMRPKDGSYEPVRMLSARLGRGKPVELSTGVRELVTVTGQEPKLVVDWLDGSPPLETKLSIPFAQDFVIVYLPKLKAGIEPWYEPFFPYARVNFAAETPAPAPDPAAAEVVAPKP